jgi:phage repressor protein C with HTH and peptisase S24 domain
MNIGAAIAKRILDRAREIGLDRDDLQRQAGVGVKYIDEVKRGKNGPTIGKLRGVKRLLNVSWDWLIEGEGASVVEAGPRAIRPAPQAQIPERDIRIAAGGGQIIEREEIRRLWGLPQSFLYSLSLNADSVEFVEIVGNSMYPLLWPGDMVLIDRRSRTPDHRAIYALWDGDATVCKWVERDRSTRGDRATFLLTSENAAENPPYKRRADETNIIGRVVWFGRRL